MVTKLHRPHHFEALFFGHFSLVSVPQVSPVSNEVDQDIPISIIFDLFFPLLRSLKRILGSDIIHENNCVRAFVKNPCNTAESLLASSVPDLQLNNMLVVNPHDVVSELHSNGDIVLVIELIVN